MAWAYLKAYSIGSAAHMDVNMRAAAIAMLVVRHFLQPYLSSPLPHTIKEAITNFSTRTLRHTRSTDCTICGTAKRRGIGTGVRLTTRERSNPVSDTLGESGTSDSQPKANRQPGELGVYEIHPLRRCSSRHPTPGSRRIPGRSSERHSECHATRV